jgi:hypothetical protein
LLMDAASVRATTSVGPPAANGTTREIGLAGQAGWAETPADKNNAAKAARIGRRMFINVSESCL